MTWKQFKAHVEACGVGDDDVIDYIDTAFLFGAPMVERFTDTNRITPLINGVQITDGRGEEE